MLGDWIKDFKSAAGFILDQGRRVVVYSGKEDYICNYVGGSEWTNATKWKNQDQFQKASLVPWKVADGTVLGQVKSGGGLSFLQVEGAGHLVPMDQPLAVSSIYASAVSNIIKSTVGADASVEALKLYNMKLLTLAYL